MKIGLTMNANAPPAALRDVVQLAEEHGYALAYVADQGFSRDVYVTLTMLAGATRSIELGPGITHPYTRHPLVAAASVATLDEIAGGRAFLGIGAGGSRTLSPLKIERERPLTTTRETVEIARRLWRNRGDAVTYEGEHFQVVEAGLDFPGRGDIDVHWAARGPQMLALGGEIADVVFLNGIPHFELERSVANVRRGADGAGRAVRVNYSAPIVYDEASRASARAKIAYRIVDSPPHVRQRLGVSADLVAEIQHQVSLFGPEAAAGLLDDDVVDHYVLDGSPEEVADKVGALFAQHGLDTLIVELSDPAQAYGLLPYAAEVVRRARSQRPPAGAQK